MYPVGHFYACATATIWCTRIFTAARWRYCCVCRRTTRCGSTPGKWAPAPRKSRRWRWNWGSSGDSIRQTATDYSAFHGPVRAFFTLSCPEVFGHFLDPPGNHPRGAIFPTVEWINQSSVDSHCKPLESRITAAQCSIWQRGVWATT